MHTGDYLLIGSTFPLSLIRRPVVITPEEVETIRNLLQRNPIMSFWGHQSTIPVANRLLGVDVTPPTSRPALRLTPENFPVLNGFPFSECWVLSPDYEEGYRPQIGEEVAAEKIFGWQVLRIRWLEK